jgi:hypothetical protein
MPALLQDTNIYYQLEQYMQAHPGLFTCVDLFDVPAIHAVAQNANHVSDALGNLYRRGYLYREPAAKTPRSQAKWAYGWKTVKPKRDLAPSQIETMAQAAYDARPEPTPKKISPSVPADNKPQMTITEHEGRVTIELASLRITIESRR